MPLAAPHDRVHEGLDLGEHAPPHRLVALLKQADHVRRELRGHQKSRIRIQRAWAKQAIPDMLPRPSEESRVSAQRSEKGGWVVRGEAAVFILAGAGDRRRRPLRYREVGHGGGVELFGAGAQLAPLRRHRWGGRGWGVRDQPVAQVASDAVGWGELDAAVAPRLRL